MSGLTIMKIQGVYILIVRKSAQTLQRLNVYQEPFPWEEMGRKAIRYQLKTAEDLEALREKVNTDGYSFDGMNFRMMADITLPSDWKPIGAWLPGHGLSENGKYLWAFSGILDGANHTLTVADGGKPLFNYVREATIENLKLYGKQIDGYGLIDRYTVDYGTDGNYNTGCRIQLGSATLLCFPA